MAESAKSTEDVRWRHLETSAKTLIVMVVLVLATVVLLHRGSDVLAAVVAATILAGEEAGRG